jgi:hypothetical protein
LDAVFCEKQIFENGALQAREQIHALMASLPLRKLFVDSSEFPLQSG